MLPSPGLAANDSGKRTGRRAISVALDLKGVHKAFGDRIVIGDLNLKIDAGEFLAILGPSGCGKSTLLRMIARLVAPDAGQIQAEPSQPKTAFVFQDAHLLPWRSVLDNVALPLELGGAEKAARYSHARTALTQVGLDDSAALYPAQLSGGMRMRVSLARALVTEPSLLLMDEPFAALDEITRFHLEVQLRDLWQRLGMTVIFVTHSISEAAFLANRALVMTRRGGKIKLDRRMELPTERGNELRTGTALGGEMAILLSAMEEE
jgi:NitT/TauT family transport system ATP-binding protein